jgi:SlyX protein
MRPGGRPADVMLSVTTLEGTAMEERLVELELRYTHQAELVRQLSDVLYAQQRQIDKLEAELGRLKETLAAEPWNEEAMPHEKPPHY